MRYIYLVVKWINSLPGGPCRPGGAPLGPEK